METLPFKPTDDDLRSEWLQIYSDTIYSRNQFYRNNDGVYQTVEEMKIRKEIIDIMIEAKEKGVSPTNSRVNSVLGLIRPEIYKDANHLDSNPDLFPLKDGVINLKTGDFSPHTKDNYISSVQTYSYNPKAKCPYFKSLLSRFDYETQQFLIENMGYWLTTWTHFEMAIWFHGSPGSGKSSAIEAAKTLLGPYMKLLPVQNLNGDKFGKSRIIGARVLYAPEIPKKAFRETDEYKAIISGEEVQIEMKHKDSFTYTPHAKSLYAMNELPDRDFLNDGIGRRIQIIMFPPLKETERDPHFKDKLKQEGPGIFNLALQGLQSLTERGYFIIPEASKRAKDELIRSNPIYLEPDEILKKFIDTKCIVKKGLWVQAEPFGIEVRSYCRNLGVKELNRSQIATGLLALDIRKTVSHGHVYYHGLTVENL